DSHRQLQIRRMKKVDGCGKKSRKATQLLNSPEFGGVCPVRVDSSRSRALPGNALPSRLCLDSFVGERGSAGGVMAFGMRNVAGAGGSLASSATKKRSSEQGVAALHARPISGAERGGER